MFRQLCCELSILTSWIAIVCKTCLPRSENLDACLDHAMKSTGCKHTGFGKQSVPSASLTEEMATGQRFAPGTPPWLLWVKRSEKILVSERKKQDFQSILKVLPFSLHDISSCRQCFAVCILSLWVITARTTTYDNICPITPWKLEIHRMPPCRKATLSLIKFFSRGCPKSRAI